MDKKKMDVLLVGDNKERLEGIKKKLEESEKYSKIVIKVCPSSQEAIEVLRHNPLEAQILDIESSYTHQVTLAIGH
ncbi:hypothetical protein KJ763_01430 [Patescibacteria group bacterium]|nr:hypothetical protein [Patescibacteria group bacterium]